MKEVFHLLPDEEPFSETNGGAISRWVANVLRDDPNSVVVCPSADGSWGFPPDRVRVSSGLAMYGKNRGLRAVVRQSPSLLRKILTRDLEDVAAGDIIWVQNDRRHAFALAPFAIERGASLVFHMHNALPFWTSTRIVREIASQPVVCCSEYLRRASQQRYPVLKQFHVLLNGADGELFHPRPNRHASQDSARILFVGRLIPEKGAHVLLDAMRVLQQRGVAAQALIVGSAGFGGLSPSNYVRKLHEIAPRNVEFLGYRSGKDLAEVFRSSSVYVQPSVWDDPFPLTVLEAMASGLPVIGSHSGGIPEELSHGGGIVVQRGNPVALADALQTILRDDKYRERTARAARIAFEKYFTWSTVRENYRSIVEEIQRAALGGR